MRHSPLLVIVAMLLATENVGMAGCSSTYNNTATPPNDWLKLDAGPFSIYAPPGWEIHKERGIDSYVGKIAGDGIELRFDFGRYSDPLDGAREPAYVIVETFVGGYQAKTVCPRTPGHGMTGIYFPSVTASNSLSLFGQNLTDTQQKVVMEMFQSVRFK
jgi:hypothetical protein